MRTILLALFLSIITLIPAQAQDTTYDRLLPGGAGGWLNITRPVTIQDLQGRAVLLDFWTYGCINCMQIVPDLDFLERKYGEKLLVIGVHSAKFEGEKGNERILAAAQRFGLNHPVINDSDYAIWKSFGVRAWPTQVLIGPDGREAARWSGEGHRTAIDAAISAATASITPPFTDISTLVPARTKTSTLSFPARIEDAGDFIFVADSGHNRILVLDRTGAVKMTIGSGELGHQDGSFVMAKFNHPRGMVLIGRNLYIADTDNHMLRVANLDSGSVMTLSGNGKRTFAPPFKAQKAMTTELASPWDVEALPDGSVAIAMAGVHQLWRYDPTARTMQVMVGSGAEAVGDGPALKATLAQPSGLKNIGSALYFVDAESSALRRVENNNVQTLVGTGLFDFGLVDGMYPDARLQHAQGLTTLNNQIVLADTYNNTLRTYDLQNGQLTTMDLKGLLLNEPGDVAAIDGKLWIADTNNHRIVVFDPATGDHRVLDITEPQKK